MTRVLLWVILPIVLTIAIGFAFERARPVEPRTLSQVSIYVLGPCLVFYSLSTTKLTGREVAGIGAFLLALTAVMWVIGKVWARVRRMDSAQEASFLLSTLFMNAGNYGIPLSLYAFGEGAVDRAVVWVLVQNAVLTPLAVYYAAREESGPFEAVKTVFRMPVVYAAVLAAVLRAVNAAPPEYVLTPIHSLGLAMIPVAQLLLGVQLSRTAAHINADASRIAQVCILRLLVAPALGWCIAGVLGLEGITAKVVVLLSATPTAVNSSILAIEFGAQPRFVSGCVFCSTVASFGTLAVLLRLLT
ncbi:MAG: AEC family transporter [Armatimonadota bacterium]